MAGEAIILPVRAVPSSSRAAHTDIMQISEQVFDEPLAWRHSGQQGQRVRIRSDGSSLLDLPRS